MTTNGNSKLLYWIMGALLLVVMAVVGWGADVAHQETATLREQLYAHEIQALGGYQRISRLEAEVEDLQRICACAAGEVIRGRFWRDGGDSE